VKRRTVRISGTRRTAGGLGIDGRFWSRVCPLLLSIFIAAQPLMDAASINLRPASLIAQSEALVPIGTSLQSVHHNLWQRTAAAFAPRRIFLPVVFGPMFILADGQSYRNLEAVHCTLPLGSVHGGRSPPFHS
jgi:hypothetical protein